MTKSNDIVKFSPKMKREVALSNPEALAVVNIVTKKIVALVASFEDGDAFIAEWKAQRPWSTHVHQTMPLAGLLDD
jgi:hypothetical protein